MLHKRLSIAAQRYAAALLDLAADAKATPQVEKDMKALNAVIENSEDFSRFLSMQSGNRKALMGVVKEIAKKGKFHELTFKFLGVVVENRRLKLLPEIVTAFFAGLSERKGEVDVLVEVARKMSAAQKKALEKAMQDQLKAKPVMHVQVKPELLGGVITTAGSVRVDDSVRGKLDRLKTAMKMQANTNLSVVEKKA